MPQRVPSTLETKLCRDVRLWLAAKGEDSSELRDVLSGLEYFIPELLREHCAEWPAGESLDGVLPVEANRAPELGVELVGTAILIDDQTETPVYVRLRLHPAEDRLDAFLCHLGEVDDVSGELLRVPYGSSTSTRLRHDLSTRLNSVVWMYTAEIADAVTTTCRRTRRCDECGSLFFRAQSAMAALCPECSHQLYGHERCDHEFKDSRCSRCFWDGSVSEYLDRPR